MTPAERIERYLDGTQKHPFDWVNNPIFYDPRPTPGDTHTEKLRAAATMLSIAAAEVTEHLDICFRASSMSNGAKAYDLVDLYEDQILNRVEATYGEPYKTTQNIMKFLPPSEVKEKVVAPNALKDENAGNLLEINQPDKAAVVPIWTEAALRNGRNVHAFTGGSEFEDWTYEVYWGSRMLDASSQVMGGDHVYSRYGSYEDVRGDLAQCGLADDYMKTPDAGKHYDIVDDAGQPVSHADRMWARAQHVFDVVERGFRTDLGAAALVAQFIIDDWLNDIENSPLDPEKVHDSLKNRPQQDIKRATQLKKIMLPYIAQKCASWIPFDEDDDLGAYYEDKIKPLVEKGDALDVDCDALKKTLFSYHPLGGFAHKDLSAEATAKHRETLAAQFNGHASTQSLKAVKRRTTDGAYFQSPAKLFDEHFYEDLDVWERAGLPFLMGAMESFRLPENAPKAAFYVAEPKGGKRASKFMKKNDVLTVREAQNVIAPDEFDASFGKKVIEKNKADEELVKKTLVGDDAVKALGVSNIVSTSNIKRIAESAEKHRKFVAAKGTQRFSPKAYMAMTMEWIDRNAEVVVLNEGWSVHHDDVQVAMRALMLATGLVERPYEGGKHRMEIFVEKHNAKGEVMLEKQDLHSLIKTLSERVDTLLDNNEEAREHYVTMARMLAVLDMHIDPVNRNFESVRDKATGADSKHQIIDWAAVDPYLTHFWEFDPDKKQEIVTIREKMREKLLTIGVQQHNFSADDVVELDKDYVDAWVRVNGDSALLHRGSPGSEVRHIPDGPTV